MKRAWSGAGAAYGSVSSRYGSKDTEPRPDPYQNVTDPVHWLNSGQGGLTTTCFNRPQDEELFNRTAIRKRTKTWQEDRRKNLLIIEGNKIRVRHGNVVGVPGFCTAAPRGRIPPGTPSLVQPRKFQKQESNGEDFSQRSSRRVSPSQRMNIVSIL